MKKIKVWHLITLSLLVGALLTIWIVSLHSSKKVALRTCEAYKSELVQYSIKVDSLEEKVYEATMLVVEKEKQLQLTGDQIERLEQLDLRRVEVIASLGLKVKAYRDSLRIQQPADTVRIVEYIEDGETKLAVPVGSSWEWSDRWARSYAGIDSTGLGYSGFEVNALPIDLTLGSRGFFKKEYVSSVSTANPYVIVEQNDVQLVQTKKASTICVVGGFVAGLLTVITIVAL